VLFQFVFVNFADAQRIFGVGDVVMYGMVILEPGADAQAVARAITDRDPALQVYTKEKFAESIAKEMDETFLPVISILVAIGFVVGAAVVGLTIYTATIERTREFGVMKAVGLGRLPARHQSRRPPLTGAGFVVGALRAWGVAQLAIEAVPGVCDGLPALGPRRRLRAAVFIVAGVVHAGAPHQQHRPGDRVQGIAMNNGDERHILRATARRRSSEKATARCAPSTAWTCRCAGEMLLITDRRARAR
jgi:hypothetical protein